MSSCSCGIGWAANQPGGGGGGGADAAPITSAAILQTRWPAVGGVHTITEGGAFMLLAGETVIDIGANQIEIVYPAKLSADGAKVAIRSTADGPVVFGEASISNIQIESLGIGANSKCVDIVSLAGRTLTWDDVTLVGQDPGIIHDVTGFFARRYIELIPIADGAKPLRFDGTIVATIGDGDVAVVPAGATTPYIAFQVLPTCSIGLAFATDRTILVSLNAGDALLDISTSATVSPDFTYVSSGCQINGPGQMYLAGSVDEKDPRTIAAGNRNAPNSQWLGDAAFEDAVTPIIITHTGGTTWDVVPFENAAAASVLTKNALTQRFDLNRDALQDWQLLGTGRTNDKIGTVSWAATVSRSGGGATRPFSARIEFSTDGGGTWDPVPESASSAEMAGSSPATLIGGAPAGFDRDTEFRLTTLGNAGTATAITAYRITVRGV